MSDIRDIIPHGTTSAEQDWFSAHQMATSLANGWRPAPQATRISTRPGEFVAHAFPCGLNAYYATQQAARRGGFVAFGSPLLLVASLAGSIGYNMWQNQKAREEAAAQWRYVGAGMAHFTNKRLAVATDTGWRNFEYDSIEAMEMEPDGIVIFQNGRPREKITLSMPLTHFILLRFLSSGEIPSLGGGSAGAPQPQGLGAAPTAQPPASPPTSPGLKSTFKH